MDLTRRTFASGVSLFVASKPALVRAGALMQIQKPHRIVLARYHGGPISDPLSWHRSTFDEGDPIAAMKYVRDSIFLGSGFVDKYYSFRLDEDVCDHIRFKKWAWVSRK